MKNKTKFFFLIQKLAMISCQCRIIVVLLAVCTCYRCARTLPKESVSGGITGASARENICEFSYRKPLSRSPTIILSRLFFRPPNYLRPPVFSVLVFCPIPSWIIRLSKIFTKKNTGKKGRISVIFPSSSFRQIFRFQRQIFWLFKNEITHDESIIRVN